MIRFIFYIALLMSISVSYGSITCTHEQVCHVMAEISKTTLKRLIPQSGDHHHHDLSPREIKPLYGAKLLATAPLDLQPWMRKILSQRKPLTSFSPEIPKKYFDLYKTKNTEALSHFWLYPEIFCHMYEKTVSALKSWKKEIIKAECPKNIFKELNQIDLKGRVVVLTHDALLPLLKSKGATVFAIRSSHHHSVSPREVKRLKDFLDKQSQTAYWIFEKNIEVPSLVKKWISPNHKVLSIDLMGNLFESSTDPIQKLVQFLGEKNE